MTKPVIYVFVNKGLHMSTGKLSSQVGHAVMEVAARATTEEMQAWVSAPHRYMVILEARSESHLRNIEKYLEERGYGGWGVVDEGANEIDPHTITAMATTILDKDDEKVQLAFSTFKTYRDMVKISLEFER